MVLPKRRRTPCLPPFIALAATLGILGGTACMIVVPADAQQKKDPEAYYRAPSSLQGKTVVLPMGTTFEGRIDGSIGSAKSRQGEIFTISVSAPVIANGSDVIIPTGSKIQGEVVEAIPADKIPKKKGYPKPIGKLRVQLTQLKTPDGVSYPIVGSLAGETVAMGGGQSGRGMGKANSAIGPTVAYVGSQSSFEAVAPGMQNRMRNSQQGPKVITKQQMMSDPILGTGNQPNSGYGKQDIRSLVHKGRDLIIMNGSPLTVKIDEPLKMAIASPGAAIDTLSVPAESSMTGGRRFAPSASSYQPSSGNAPIDTQGVDPAGSINTGPVNPLPGILPDTPHGSTTSPPMGAPVNQGLPGLPPAGGMPQGGPGQGQAPGQGQPPGQGAPPGNSDPGGSF